MKRWYEQSVAERLANNSITFEDAQDELANYAYDYYREVEEPMRRQLEMELRELYPEF